MSFHVATSISITQSVSYSQNTLSRISIYLRLRGQVLRRTLRRGSPKSDLGTLFEGRKVIMKELLGFVIPAILLCGMWAEGATVQVSDTSQPSATKFVGWDAFQSNTPDVTVTAIIQQAVTNRAGGPAGPQLGTGHSTKSAECLCRALPSSRYSASSLSRQTG